MIYGRRWGGQSGVALGHESVAVLHIWLRGRS